MQFEFDIEIQEMAKVVTEFARRDLKGSQEDLSLNEFRNQWQLAATQGLVGMTVPSAYGGSDCSAVAACGLLEALTYGCPNLGFAFSLAAHLFACTMPIVHLGSDEQKRRWLPPLTSGERIAAHCITEPNAGSDALSLETRAEKDANHYVLNGSKCFTTNAPVADIFLVQAATRKGGGFFGLSTFLVEAENPGLKVGRPYSKLGLRGSPIADVYLEDCRVPASQLLASEGSGAIVFSSSMKWERTCLFAAYLGVMKRSIESTIDYANERRQFSVPIGSFQAVSHRIVDMRLRYDAARLLLLRAAAQIDQGSDDEIAPALAKLAVSEAAVQLGLDAVQLRGALGILDGEAETFLRDAIPSRIFSGTNEIQKNNIARALGIGSRSARTR